MGATGGDELVDALRRIMLAVGEQLIAELARDDKLSGRGFKHSDDATILKEWKEPRSMVETLAEKYVEAIAEYRQSMEKTIRVQPKRRGSCCPTPNRSPRDEGCPYCVNGFSDLFRPLRTIGTGQDVFNRRGALGSCTQLCRNKSPQFHPHPVK